MLHVNYCYLLIFELEKERVRNVSEKYVLAILDWLKIVSIMPFLCTKYYSSLKRKCSSNCLYIN